MSYPVFILGLVAGVMGCVGDFDAGRYDWVCETDRECGAGWRCEDKLCVSNVRVTPEVAVDVVDAIETEVAPEVTAPAECGVDRGEGGVAFVIERGDTPALTVSIGEVSGTFVFAPDVVLLEAPIAGCCEMPCCSGAE